MSVRDQVTKFNLVPLILPVTIGANGVTNGASVDNADSECGLSFLLSIMGVRTDGDFTLSLEESDDDSTWAAVPAEKIIHGGDDTPGNGGVTSVANVVLSAATALKANSAKIGVFSNKRYVRPVITAAAVTTGATLVTVQAVKHEETIPA